MADHNSDSALQELVQGNKRFVEGASTYPRQDAARRDSLTGGQQPFATILSCADSRVAPELLFDQGLGDLFVIRVAGYVLDQSVVASLEYAVLHLGCPLVVVLGHESCGAVQAAKDKPDLTPSLQGLIECIDTGTAECSLEESVICHVKHLVDGLPKKSPAIAERIAAGASQLKPGYYELGGTVRWL